MAKRRYSKETNYERKSLSHMVFNHIYRAIKSGSYSINERLPTESDLAAEFEVSRPIIREALKKLRDQNLIYSRQGVGSFVRQNGIKDPLGFSPVESLTDLKYCYEFREIIEPASAAAAAERRTETNLAEIASALAEMKDATNEGRHRANADFEFHLAIARASGNQYLQTAIESLKEHIAIGMTSHGMHLKHEFKGLDTVYSEHEAIYLAIKNKDPESARFLMRNHVSGSMVRTLDI
ncbi:putative transcriptional regulator [Vibrio nigripulchritudo SOn1]|uniref:Transcriptional regulator n=1 Tax=Vibrio nigripulchritudo SOn1 TaxID=1238450 RepID=A0AAV2W208_9VIBR|nr:FadR/GntR family transcriptional regulator [Vibrio nigripulchritudo]CCO50308.1 putative transcriptional regulator [Vibrio nigripulchritudo SOn1]